MEICQWRQNVNGGAFKLIQMIEKKKIEWKKKDPEGAQKNNERKNVLTFDFCYKFCDYLRVFFFRCE